MQGKYIIVKINGARGLISIAVPSNILLNKFGRPAVYLPSCMIVWGIISAATGAVQSYEGLLACRFFLGFVEAAYFVSASWILPRPFHT